MIHALHARLKDDSRFARVLKGGASGVAGKIAAVVVNAVSLPITIRYLGPEQYGFWVTISTTIMMFAVPNPGIAYTLTHCISRAYAERYAEMAKQYLAAAACTRPADSLPRRLLSTVIWPHIDW